MNLGELIRRFRVIVTDEATDTSGDGKDRLWSDEDIAKWLSEGEKQAAIRGRLLLEDSDEGVCSIAIEVGQRTYKLHSKLYELVDLRFTPSSGTCSQEVKLVSREWLENRFPGWRDRQQLPGGLYAIQSETSLRMVPTPEVDGVLWIEGYRLPMREMKAPADKPEIHEAHHERLIDWAVHKAFLVPDADAVDARRSSNAEAAFSAYFGPEPDAGLRRSTRADTDHVNRVHL